MAEILTCPDAASLRKLLDGQLSDEQQAQLDQHLEGCPNCQKRLEGLAAGSETWTAAARNLPAGLATPEAGLERILAESKRPEQVEVEAPPLDAALAFLSPPDDSAHLGRLGNYQILSVIGRGGMSVVLKGFDPSLHRVVAIKVLAPQLATNAAARTRFRREGFAAAAISHEHVVAVYAVDEVKGLPYLVMEYISGESLQERLGRDGPLELKEVLRIGMQTAQGLAAAHAQGLVHRDIKPANILLHNGVARVKITDFGLARAVDDATLTQSGLIAGTPQYMSPEQARGEAIDARTDLFSLGSVLYAMCAGRPPFRASTTMGVLRRVSDESPRAMHEVNAEVPPWLAEIIAKLHAKNPVERFQSAAEVAELLGRHLAQVQQGSPPSPASVLSVSTSPPAPRRSGLIRKRPWAIAAALLPVIAGLFVASEATGVTHVTEFMATVLRIQTPDGTLVVETDDPGIEVVVDGGDIKIHGAGPKEIRVRAGDHRIRATKDGKEVPVEQPLVTVTRGGKTIVRIRQELAQGEAKTPKASTPKSDAGDNHPPKGKNQPEPLHNPATAQRDEKQPKTAPNVRTDSTGGSQTGAKAAPPSTGKLANTPEMASAPTVSGREAPPSTDRVRVGHYHTGTGGPPSLLVQRKSDKDDWGRVKPGTRVSTNDQLMSLPGYASEVWIENGLHLLLRGHVREFTPPKENVMDYLQESAIVLHKPKDTDADVTLQRGRLYLSNHSTKQPGTIVVRLRFENKVWDLTLHPGSEVVLDLLKSRRGGEPMAAMNLFLLQGNAGLVVEQDNYPNLSVPGLAYFLWDSTRPSSYLPQQIGKPQWDHATRVLFAKLPTLNSAEASGMERALTTVKKMWTTVDESPLAVLRRVLEKKGLEMPYEHRLAIYCLGAMDEIQELVVNILNKGDLPNSPDRMFALVALRRWLDRGPNQAQKLFDSETGKGLLKDFEFTRDEAERIMILLRDPTFEQVFNSKSYYEDAARDLTSDRVAIAELARWRLAGLAIGMFRLKLPKLDKFNAAIPRTDRTPAMQEVLDKINEGLLPPPEKGKARPGGTGRPSPKGNGSNPGPRSNR
jgi:serine/threonine protein kinase